MSRFAKMKAHKVVADAFNYKYIVAGRPKAGKTSLVYGITKEKYDGDLSKLLLIAFEKGYNALDGVFAEDIETWTDFTELVDDLIDEKDDIPFKILAFDTVDIMAKYATEYVLKKQSRKDGKRYDAIGDIGYGKGYELLEVEMATQITKLDKAGFSLIFITHDKDKQFETREGLKYDKTTLSLSGRVRDLVLNMVDFIVFVELGKEVEKGKAVDKRYIYFRGDSGLEAGSRFKHVPNRIEYGYREFLDTVEDAILKEYNGDRKAVEEAKQEQAESKNSKVEEFIKSESVSVEDVIKEITNTIKGLDAEGKSLSKNKVDEVLGYADYRKCEDVEDLNKILEFVKGI